MPLDLVWQPTQRCHQIEALERHFRHDVRRRRKPTGPEEVVEDTPPPESVARQIERDRAQPCLVVGHLKEPPRSGDRSDERLLHNVLRLS
ncbi:hypothetical protein Asi02nite_77890 [Asanoa siamensis]|uniref:Uncharacterized protein n=1 Tax=Asanoa siamensis TaxID=926357 RepID=A0ABQ4D400_9ACTN|nr:hypothetical protein [Asanoa siamensis]GIF78271.1 hypothetical protein Asi02nite_77890 [Asanoa siamensis]